MDQTTQTPGSNAITTTATPQAPAAPTPTTTTASPQSLAERIAEYRNIPGVFDDSPLPPKVAPPAEAPTPASPEEALEKMLKDETFPADIKTDGAKANWKALREKAKAARDLETKWKEAQAEIEKLKTVPPSTPADPVELANLKKERDEISERLKLLDLERHPGFEAHFRQKTDAVVAEIKQIGGVEHGERLAAIMKLPESDYKTAQLEDIYTKLPMVKQGQLASALRDWDKIGAERTTELAKAKEKYDKIQAIQQEQTKKAQQERVTKLTQALDANLAEAQKTIPLFQKRDGDEKWNRAVEERINNAKTILKSGTNEDGYTRALIWSQVAPELIQESIADKQRIAALEKELSERKAAVPKPGSGESPTTSSSPPVNMSLADRIVWAAQQSGAVIR